MALPSNGHALNPAMTAILFYTMKGLFSLLRLRHLGENRTNHSTQSSKCVILHRTFWTQADSEISDVACLTCPCHQNLLTTQLHQNHCMSLSIQDPQYIISHVQQDQQLQNSIQTKWSSLDV